MRESELARHFVAERRGPHLRNRKAAGRDHQRRALERPARRLHFEPAAASADPRHRAGRLDADARRRAFRLQHLHDFAGGTVAEQLPERLLVVGDAVALHHAR